MGLGFGESAWGCWSLNIQSYYSYCYSATSPVLCGGSNTVGYDDGAMVAGGVATAAATVTAVTTAAAAAAPAATAAASISSFITLSLIKTEYWDRAGGGGNIRYEW